MKRNRIDVLVQCDADALQTVLDVLKGTAELISAKPAKPAQVIQPVSRFRDGKRVKGINGIQLAMTVLKAAGGSLVHMDTFKEAFVAKGFMATSASPVLTELFAAGKVERPMPGFFRLPVAG